MKTKIEPNYDAIKDISILSAAPALFTGIAGITYGNVKATFISGVILILAAIGICAWVKEYKKEQQRKENRKY